MHNYYYQQMSQYNPESATAQESDSELTLPPPEPEAPPPPPELEDPPPPPPAEIREINPVRAASHNMLESAIHNAKTVTHAASLIHPKPSSMPRIQFLFEECSRSAQEMKDYLEGNGSSKNGFEKSIPKVKPGYDKYVDDRKKFYESERAKHRAAKKRIMADTNGMKDPKDADFDDSDDGRSPLARPSKRNKVVISK